jgi:hypothetical protein
VSDLDAIYTSPQEGVATRIECFIPYITIYM